MKAIHLSKGSYMYTYVLKTLIYNFDRPNGPYVHRVNSHRHVQSIAHSLVAPELCTLILRDTTHSTRYILTHLKFSRSVICTFNMFL